LELTAEEEAEAEEESEHSEEWLNAFSDGAEETATWEFAVGAEEEVGDHDDLPNGQKFLQLRRLQKQDQPLEQLDEVIEEIMELMLKSEDTANRVRLSRRVAAAAGKAAATAEWSRWKAPDICLGSRRISNSLEGKHMSRSS
jgi:hypothetical protein